MLLGSTQDDNESDKQENYVDYQSVNMIPVMDEEQYRDEDLDYDDEHELEEVGYEEIEGLNINCHFN